MNKTAKIISAAVSGVAAIALCTTVLLLNRHSKSDDPTFSAVTEATTLPEPAIKAVPADWADKYDYVSDPTGYTARARELLRLNQDVIGWIKMYNTKVDYPVLLDPGAIPENKPFYGPEAYDANYFYLTHDLDASYKRSGTLYLDYRDKFEAEEDLQSENLVIYGHNMMDNSMFGSLRRYRQDYAFYDQCPFVEFSSNYKDYDYVIFAFLITSGSYNSTDFRYWNQEELDTKEEFDAYVARCRRDAMIDTGIDVQYGDQLLTLSTCYADEDNSRFILVARRLRDGESPDDLASVKHTEEYIKAHQPTTEATTEAK